MLIRVLLLSVLLTACSEQSEESESKVDLVDGKHCYMNEYPFEDQADAKDVMELTIIVQGKAVTGSYNWLPAFKDQRTGAFKGSINNGAIKANYMFMQEGKEATADLEIKLHETEAVVKSSDVQLGLAANIEKVECGD